MKDVKITNFTTKDYCILFLISACYIGLSIEAYNNIIEGEYFRAAGAALGALGWIVLYFRKTKEIRDKNPQDKD